MNKCAIPKLIEKQQSLLCGKHAINNLLQQKRADCNKLKAGNFPDCANSCRRCIRAPSPSSCLLAPLRRSGKFKIPFSGHCIVAQA